MWGGDMTFILAATIEPAIRWPVAIAYCLHPKRIKHVPGLFLAGAKSLLNGGVRLPSRDRVISLEMLFGGIAREISAETVLQANRLGFFLESHAGPLKWWTLEDRMIVDPNALRINSRLRSQIRNSGYSVTFDTDFKRVVERCAEPRPGRPPVTWISKELISVYCALFRKGYAHSFEVRNSDGDLVGGGYGLAFGRVFVLESMFHGEKNASKIGLVALNRYLAKAGYRVSDAKAYGALYARLGYKLHSRQDFEDSLDIHASEEFDRIGHWTDTPDLEDVSHWKPASAGN